MFKTIALLFAAVATVTAQDDDFKKVEAPPAPGSYTPVDVTSANVEMLQIAISSPQSKAYNGNSICINHVDSLEIQTVAGFNYKYSVNGCELPADKFLGYCQKQVKCRRSQFDVVVFTQSWTNTMQVTSITRTQ